MIFKYAATRRLERFALLTANYLTAFLLALLALDHGSFAPDARLVTLCIVTGGLFIGTFFMLALATAVAGMSLATAVMRISVVIPFLASWTIFNEVPSPYQMAGLLTGGTAFFFIARRPRELDPTLGAGAAREDPRDPRTFLVLGLLFIMGGLIDTLMKTFGEVFAAEHGRATFMTIVFGMAFAIGLTIVLARRRPVGASTLIWGVLLGAVNFASVEFILRAIERLSGTFVFPANNILLVIGGALLGVLFWKERLTGMNWAGLVLAALALILLNF